MNFSSQLSQSSRRNHKHGSFNAAFQVGANAGETISVNISKAMGAAGLGVDGVDVTGEGDYAFATGTGSTAGSV